MPLHQSTPLSSEATPFPNPSCEAAPLPNCEDRVVAWQQHITARGGSRGQHNHTHFAAAQSHTPSEGREGGGGRGKLEEPSIGSRWDPEEGPHTATGPEQSSGAADRVSGGNGGQICSGGDTAYVGQVAGRPGESEEPGL